MKLFKYDISVTLGYDGGFIALPLSLSYSGMKLADTPLGLVPYPVSLKAWVARLFCFYLMVEAYEEGM